MPRIEYKYLLGCRANNHDCMKRKDAFYGTQIYANNRSCPNVNRINQIIDAPGDVILYCDRNIVQTVADLIELHPQGRVAAAVSDVCFR